MTKHIKTRLLLLSDTHANAPHPSTATSQPCRWPLPSADVAIHTGDLTLTGKISEHEQAIDLLERLQADLKIVIPGNHDLTLDTAYYAEKGHLHGPDPRYVNEQLEHIRNMYTGPEAHAANIVYLEEGTRTFQLRNGATLTIYASAYTPEFCEWAFAYPRDHDRFNPPDAENQVASYDADSTTNIDVMLTHGPPYGILDSVDDGGRGASTDKRHVGCEHLLRAVTRAKPLLHCFGHIHEGWGAVRKEWQEASRPEEGRSPENVSTNVETMVKDMGVLKDFTDLERGRETLFVNSSIMDVNYNPRQGPWVIDLMLDKTK